VQREKPQPHIQGAAAAFNSLANCNSVTRMAASGMLLTSPTWMAVRLRPPPSRNCSTGLIAHLPQVAAHGGGQRLVQIGDDVVAMLNTDRQTDGFRRHAGLALLGLRHLAMGGGSRMAGQRFGVADIDQALDQSSAS